MGSRTVGVLIGPENHDVSNGVQVRPLYSPPEQAGLSILKITRDTNKRTSLVALPVRYWSLDRASKVLSC